jgi:hypothetical protein
MPYAIASINDHLRNHRLEMHTVGFVLDAALLMAAECARESAELASLLGIAMIGSAQSRRRAQARTER